jgi:hypothetical protein
VRAVLGTFQGKRREFPFVPSPSLTSFLSIISALEEISALFLNTSEKQGWEGAGLGFTARRSPLSDRCFRQFLYHHALTEKG